MPGRMHVVRLLWLLVLSITVLSSPASASRRVLARFDLNQRADFEAFKGLEIAPLSRVGNVFFAEVEKSDLLAVRQAGIPYAIVDHQPDEGRYYLGPIESLLSRTVPAPDLEALTDVGNQTLYKSAYPIDRDEYREYGFDVCEIQQREIPLKYIDEVTYAPGLAAADNDPDLEAIMAAISQDSLYAHTIRLEAYQTRLALSDSNRAARDWIMGKFQSYGYTDVFLDPFWLAYNGFGGSGECYNVICHKPGTADPDKVIVIGGHFDSILLGGDPWTFAPGADDNAGSVAALLEMARVMSTLPIKKSIYFIAFDAEEQGMVGAGNVAHDAYVMGTDLELMINMDNIGYNTSETPQFTCEYAPGCRPFAELMAEMSTTYTELAPRVRDVYGTHNTDYVPFYEYGFDIASTIEYPISPYYHTPSDLSTNMDFAYMTEMTKICLATLYTASNYPSIITGGQASDVGNGQALYVEWDPATATDLALYRIFWGTSSQTYTDSVDVAADQPCNVTIEGLVDGQNCYVSVVAIDSSGYESYLRWEFTGVPRLIPLAPDGVTAEPALGQVELTWQPNQELDFDHYNIYRGTTPGVYTLREADYTGTFFWDAEVAAGIMYEYVVTAVDGDGYESVYSDAVQGAAATFDQGILILDATSLDAGNPSIVQKEAFFDAVFAGYPVAYHYYDPATEDLNRSILGLYEAVFWIDDGNAAASWTEEDLDNLRWYLNYNTNVMMAGWRMAFELSSLTSPKIFYPGDLMYDNVGLISTQEVAGEIDFQGGVGALGFPDVVLDTSKVYSVWDGKMGWIGITADLRPGTETIYTFNSYSGDYTGWRVGVRRDNGNSKVAFLSMPFYYLRTADARAAVDSVMSWFNVELTCDCSQFCDLNRDGALNPVDVVSIVQFVYRDYDPPVAMGMCFQGSQAPSGDWNCDGTVNPVDVVYYVNFVYRDSGLGPCDPCACSPYPGGCP